MKRWDLINYLINKYDLKNYLEIGVDAGISMSNVSCGFKIGVDPRPKFNTANTHIDIFFRMTSDEFFAKWAGKVNFDIVFIDGLHEEFQVLKDILGSIKKARFIVLHDCNPPNKDFEGLNHCGTVWRAARRVIELGYIQMVVVEDDFGCGVMKVPENPLALDRFTKDLSRLIERNIPDPSLTFEGFNANREILRITTEGGMKGVF